MDTPAEQRIQPLRAACNRLAVELLVVFGSDEPRKDRQTAVLDDEIMVTTPEGDAAHLGHPQPAPFRSVIEGHLFEQDDTVGDGMKLQVLRMGGQVIEQQHRALPAGEEVLESEDLAPVAQRVLRQEPHLR